MGLERGWVENKQHHLRKLQTTPTPTLMSNTPHQNQNQHQRQNIANNANAKTSINTQKHIYTFICTNTNNTNPVFYPQCNTNGFQESGAIEIGLLRSKTSSETLSVQQVFSRKNQLFTHKSPKVLDFALSHHNKDTISKDRRNLQHASRENQIS